MICKKEKARIAGKAWRTKNAEYVREYKRNYDKNNPDKKSESGKRYRTKAKDEIARKRKIKDAKNKDKKSLYDKEYRAKNKGRLSASKRSRELLKKNAQPKWLTKFDLEYIRHIYIQSKELQKLDGIKYHVDHIIPLVSDVVCGLHVPWNLQILEASINMSKKNTLPQEL